MAVSNGDAAEAAGSAATPSSSGPSKSPMNPNLVSPTSPLITIGRHSVLSGSFSLHYVYQR